MTVKNPTPVPAAPVPVQRAEVTRPSPVAVPSQPPVSNLPLDKSPAPAPVPPGPGTGTNPNANVTITIPVTDVPVSANVIPNRWVILCHTDCGIYNIMFSANRLGFWFRYPLQPDRRLATNRVLVFYDNYTQGPGGNTDYYNTVGDVNPGTDVWPTIRDQEISLGMQPELIVGYNNLPADLTQYAHLWDIGYASPYIGNPTLNPTSLLLNYLSAGGAMFMLGENANFGVRDDAIDTFVTAAGGGTITRSATDYNYSVTATVEPEFLLANNNNSVVFSRPGTFTAVGTGTPMSTAFTGTEYPAVCWKTGSLSNAVGGAVTAVLDINIFVAGATLQPDFIDNLSLTLNKL